MGPKGRAACCATLGIALACAGSPPPLEGVEEFEECVEEVVEPTYPEHAIGEGLSGWVELRAQLGPDGEVLDPRVTASQPLGVFDEAALDAYRQWRYCPGPEEAPGRDVAVRIRFEAEAPRWFRDEDAGIHFRLPRGWEFRPRAQAERIADELSAGLPVETRFLALRSDTRDTGTPDGILVFTLDLGVLTVLEDPCAELDQSFRDIRAGDEFTVPIGGVPFCSINPAEWTGLTGSLYGGAVRQNLVFIATFETRPPLPSDVDRALSAFLFDY